MTKCIPEPPTFEESRLVFFDGFRITLLIRVHLTHQGMELKGVRVQCLEHLDRAQRCILGRCALIGTRRQSL